jgi:uncharacterized LabA/DUF88 family protein
MADAPRVAVVMDYQNIHLTARDIFAPYGTPTHETLIHPLLFAERLLAVRAAKQGDEVQRSAVLSAVYVYRGAPSNAHQPDLYRYSQAQRAEWTRDPRVHVIYRTLWYAKDFPSIPPREKGVDVLVAINLVRLAEQGDCDVVILAAHDTDLEPALEMAAGTGRRKIETAGWTDCKRLRIPGRNLWHTALDGNEFVLSRDRRKYT